MSTEVQVATQVSTDSQDLVELAAAEGLNTFGKEPRNARGA
jgi:hypothetical protein